MTFVNVTLLFSCVAFASKYLQLEYLLYFHRFAANKLTLILVAGFFANLALTSGLVWQEYLATGGEFFIAPTHIWQSLMFLNQIAILEMTYIRSTVNLFRQLYSARAKYVRACISLIGVITIAAVILLFTAPDAGKLFLVVSLILEILVGRSCNFVLQGICYYQNWR